MSTPNPKAWLRPMLKPLKPVYREVFAISLFVNILALATPIFVLQVYDRVVFYSGFSTLKALVVGMGIVVLFDFTLRQSRTRMLQKAALRLDVHVGRKLFEKLLAIPLIELERRPSAFWQALFRDIEVVRNTLSGNSATLIADLPFAFLFLALVFVIATPIAWVLFMILPVFMFLAARSGQTLRSVGEAERGAGFARDTLISEMIAGRNTVKALALEASLRPAWEERHANTIEHSLRRGSSADGYVNFGAMLAVITTVAMTAAGALAIIDQQMTIGSLIAANILASRIIAPFNQLINTWRNYTSFRQATTRLGEVFLIPDERQRTEMRLERPEGELRVEDMTFKYGENSEPAIDGIRIKIKPPGLLGIIGANGSGKTTLLKLLQGLYRPESGRILLDGGDIEQFTRKELAHWIGYVPQECFLFAGTIRDNIIKGRPDSPDEDVMRAAQKVGLHAHVIDLPDGYGTEVGEGGGRLPGGLRQRIAIARALVGDPPVLLMDEPSSNLDRQGEEELRASLLDLASDHTVIIVTHSPALLGACKALVALDRGKIARVGAPAEVLPELFGGQGAASPLRREA